MQLYNWCLFLQNIFFVRSQSPHQNGFDVINAIRTVVNEYKTNLYKCRQRKNLPVGFNPPVFDGAMPAKPNAAKLANGFFDNPLI